DRIMKYRVLLPVLCAFVLPLSARAQPTAFLEKHCYSCHDAETKKGGLDLKSLKTDPESFARWVKVHDRIESGEMPPGKKEKIPAGDRAAAVKVLHGFVVKLEQARIGGEGRTVARRLTRVEYEHTVRDLLELTGIPLQAELPADGSAHG